MLYAILTFHTSHFAMKAKKSLDALSLPGELIPLPREFSSQCGLCLKVVWEEKDRVSQILAENKVIVHQIHCWNKEEDMHQKFIFV